MVLFGWRRSALVVAFYVFAMSRRCFSFGSEFTQFNLVNRKVNRINKVVLAFHLDRLECRASVGALVDNVKVTGQLALLLVALVKKVIYCRYLVVLVGVECNFSLLFLEAILLEHSHYRRLHRYFVFADDKPKVFDNGCVICLVPRMSANVLSSVPFFRVDVQYLIQQVRAL
jgi:hypothetical protein